LKLPVQCDEARHLYGFDLTTATVDDHKLLDPLPRWMTDGMVVGDGGSLSPAKARALAARGVYLLTPTRKNMRHLASQFQVACLPLRHRGEEIFAVLKNAFGAVRTTHRAPYALPIHLLCWLLAYSLYKPLIAYTFHRESRCLIGNTALLPALPRVCNTNNPATSPMLAKFLLLD
jgi:hypothetical protein